MWKCEPKEPLHGWKQMYQKLPQIISTKVTENSYPLNMHRGPDSGGKTHIKKVNGHDLAVDNSFVVPYNRILYLRFQAYINVEIVYSEQAVKNLYKYITKGQDQVLLGFGEDTEKNEINRYVNARYISASEALWRLCGFEIHRKHPPVEKLPCHLPDQQTVLFESGQVGEAVETAPPPTKRTAFFI